MIIIIIIIQQQHSNNRECWVLGFCIIPMSKDKAKNFFISSLVVSFHFLVKE